MTQEEVIEIVKNNNPIEFSKFGTFQFYITDKEEEIVTEIKGEKETKNKTKVGDYILTGISGERYVLSPETFRKRYQVVVGDENSKLGYAKPIGKWWGNEYTGDPITFTASWGEEMICNTGDYLGSPDENFSSAYRIEKEAFLKTYKPA